MNQREYNSGYQAAIDAIREHIKNQRKNGQQQLPQQGGQGQQSQDGRMMPPGMGDASQQGQDSSGSSQQGQQSQAGGGSTSGRGGGNQGVVQPEDCIGPNSLSDVPGVSGGYFDRKTGDQIAKQEGYDKGDGGNDDQVAREWKDNALKAAKQLKQQTDKNKGSGAAAFAARLESIYKPSKDWKKELKRIVGQAINPEDPRQAFAHKNTLVSQDRIARTNKDKYDSLDYMVAMVDTSGSMSEKDIKACLAEVYGVALAKKPIKLVLMYFGSGVSQINVFKNLTDFKKEMKSPRISAGGGTEVGPCFTMLQNDPQFRHRVADIVMVFTDGYLDQVKRNPKITKNLCWVIIDNPGFDLQYKDIKTKCVHIKKEDME